MNRSNDDGKPSQDGTNRRDFLKYSALVAGYGVFASGSSPQAKAVQQQSPNERVNIAWVGVGGKGDSDSQHAMNNGNLVAICDVDETHLDKKMDEIKKKDLDKGVKRYNDWRKLLDEMGDKIDAVGVSIPDHNHAIVSMHAIKMGKAVYCQKPLTHTVAEARAIREAAAEKKVATQMGNQGTATDGLRTGVDIIRAGVIGKVKEVHIWTDRPIWPQAPEVMTLPPKTEMPGNLNWDVWLGTAPFRPFSGILADNGHGPYHDFNWRGWWDFGTGALGDMGCHTCNMPFMGLNLHEVYPTSVKGVCGDLNPLTYPSWGTVHYEFPARGDMPPVKVTWYEGHFGHIGMRKDNRSGNMVPDRIKNLPNAELFQGAPPSQSGSLIVGDKDTIYSPHDYGGVWYLLGSKKKNTEFKEYHKLPRTQGDDNAQKAEWVAAIKGGPKAMANFDYAGKLVEFILLGNVANRVPGQLLKWDGPEMKITNHDKANDFLKTEYRKGWSLT